MKNSTGILTKRMLSLLLVAIMAFGLFPMGVFAEDTQFTVTYDANSGQGTDVNGNTYTQYVDTASDVNYVVLGNDNENINFIKENYAFIGWSTSIDGDVVYSVEEIEAGTATITISEDVTLYAVWEEWDIILDPMITYYPNYEEHDIISDGYEIGIGITYTVLDYSETNLQPRDGYVFIGWSTDKDATEPDESYAPGNTFTVAEDVNLYAVWEAEEVDTDYYTVTYYAEDAEDGGVPVDTDSPYETGSTVTVLEDDGLTRDGYYFDGWYTVDEDENMVDHYYAGDTFTIEKNTELYAKWIKIIEFIPDHIAYIIGYEDNNIRPLANITRAESVTIFFRLFTDETRGAYWSTENDYTDVDSSFWYNNAISTLTNAGAVEGYDDTTDFKPNADITRAQFVKIVVYLYGTDSYAVASDFTDISGHWAEEVINIAYAQGLIEGDSDSTLFRPDDMISRAEAMMIVNRLLDRDTEIGEYHDDMITWADNTDTTEWYYAAVQEATNSHEYELKEDGKEYWTTILETPDWAALENEWANSLIVK